MNLQQHKEAWEDFLSPFLVDYVNKNYLQIISVALINDRNASVIKAVEKWFLTWSFEMQLGVYLKYLDKKGIKTERLGFTLKGHGNYDIMRDWEYVVEQAFKIINEQLKS